MINIQNHYTIYKMLCSSYKKKKKIKRWQKLLSNLYDKEKYVVHIRTLKQALNHGLILKRVHAIIKASHNVWLKS